MKFGPCETDDYSYEVVYIQNLKLYSLFTKSFFIFSATGNLQFAYKSSYRNVF